MRYGFTLILLFQLTSQGILRAQDTTVQTQDSIQHAFITAHDPLTPQELYRYVTEKKPCLYGVFLPFYLDQIRPYALNKTTIGPEIRKRKIEHREWIFYSFAGLFFLLALIRYFWQEYFDKMLPTYVNQGNFLRKKMGAIIQTGLPSALLNTFFLLAGSFFLFFGLGSNYVLDGINRWKVLLFIFATLTLVYFFKYYFLQFLGWIFKEEDAFEQYSFIVFLNNKIAGILMLIAAFLMAFSGADYYKNIFLFMMYLLVFLFGLRLINALRIFTFQTKVGMLNFFLAFISFELLPSALVVKFAFQSISLMSEVVL